ncbi:acyl transferase [Kitasatospora sp. NPDC096147]|uniref:acyl transferase n=1 Tax=Kitasatospora sp. NPDC096147 TaxID=3364093 RepID=UPI0038223770
MTSAPRLRADRAGTVHLFPGQGDFGLGPLLRALSTTPSLRRALGEVFEEVDQVAPELGVLPIGPRLTAATAPSARDLAAEMPGTLQLAQFGVSLAVHRALEEDGLVAGRFVAVSFGEIPALTAADSCSIGDGARLAGRLGQLLTSHGGGMTLLGAGPFEARRLLAQAGPEAVRTVLACVNHAGETVISGPLPDLEAAERCAGARGVAAQRLRLPFMSHHPGLAEEAAAFEQYARLLRLEPPRRPVFSAVAGRLHGAGTDLPKALGSCLVKAFSLPTVLPSGLGGAALAVEMGTGSALAGAVRAVAPGVRALAPLAEGPWPAPAATWLPARVPAQQAARSSGGRPGTVAGRPGTADARSVGGEQPVASAGTPAGGSTAVPAGASAAMPVGGRACAPADASVAARAGLPVEAAARAVRPARAATAGGRVSEAPRMPDPRTTRSHRPPSTSTGRTS